MFKLNESKKLNRKILVNEDRETYKIVRVKDKETLKTLYDDKSLVIEAVDTAEENLNRVIDILKKEKAIAQDTIVNIYIIKGTFLNDLFNIEDRLKYKTNTNIISIMLSDLTNISKLMQSQLRFTLGIKWMDNLLDNLSNNKTNEILEDESNEEEEQDELELNEEPIEIETESKELIEDEDEESTEKQNEPEDIKKYAIFTDRETFPVIKKDGKYLITRQHNADFSGNWELISILPVGASLRKGIEPEEAIATIEDWKFKNGNPRYTVVDKDHGTLRRWGNKINSFNRVDDNLFSIITDGKSIFTESKSTKYLNTNLGIAKLEYKSEKYQISKISNNEIIAESTNVNQLKSISKSLYDSYMMAYNDKVVDGNFTLFEWNIFFQK